MVRTMDKLNWGTRAFAVLVLCAVTAITLPAQTLTTLFNFDGTNGARPRYESLVQGIDGNLYGTTSEGGSSTIFGTVFVMTPQGQLNTLNIFETVDGGAHPDAGLTVLPNGMLYGTSYAYGTGGQGTIFQITPGGTLTTLSNFDSTKRRAPLRGAGGGEQWDALWDDVGRRDPRRRHRLSNHSQRYADDIAQLRSHQRW
jgi:uncharacterized repeat protein (TIGR03803 family)